MRITESIRTKLRGLDPAAVYTLANLDVPGVTELTGRELMESGLPLVIKNRPVRSLSPIARNPSKGAFPVRIVSWLGIVAAFLFASCQSAAATSPTPAEMNEARQWASAHWEDASKSKPLFSFTYDGKPSAELLGKWELKQTSRQIDPERTEHTLTYTDPQSGLAVRCVGVAYADFPVVEWTVYFRNAGQSNTPIVENIQALDMQFQRRGGDEFVLRGIRGDYCAPECYEPYEHTLGPKANEAFAPAGGRPTNGAFPYYNLSQPGGGLIMALGWPGQWATSFTRNGKLGLRMTAGQQLTHLYLKPGEEIRTPLVVLLFWKGSDVLRAQNLWRRWMLAHNVPRPGGKLPKPLAVECCENFYDFRDGLPEMRQAVEAYEKAGVKLDYCWRDAGWYPGNGWPQTGTWELDPKRFPQGFKPFTDWLHARGLKFVTWFEPERMREEPGCTTSIRSGFTATCSISAIPRPGIGSSTISTS